MIGEKDLICFGSISRLMSYRVILCGAMLKLHFGSWYQIKQLLRLKTRSTVTTRFALSRLAGNVDIKLEFLSGLQVFAELIPASDVRDFNVESIGNEVKRVTLSHGIAQRM